MKSRFLCGCILVAAVTVCGCSSNKRDGPLNFEVVSGVYTAFEETTYLRTWDSLFIRPDENPDVFKVERRMAFQWIGIIGQARVERRIEHWKADFLRGFALNGPRYSRSIFFGIDQVLMDGVSYHKVEF
jgi:hypothetical protein